MKLENLLDASNIILIDSKELRFDKSLNGSERRLSYHRLLHLSLSSFHMAQFKLHSLLLEFQYRLLLVHRQCRLYLCTSGRQNS